MIAPFLIDGFFLILPHTLACIPHGVFSFILFAWSPPFVAHLPHHLYFSSLHDPISSNSRFHPIAESIADHFRFDCRPVTIPICFPNSIPVSLPANFQFFLSTNFQFAYQPISSLLASRFPICLPVPIPIHLPISIPVPFPLPTNSILLSTGSRNLATFILLDKVAKVLFAQMKNEGSLCAYIAKALYFLSMWDKS